MPRTFDELQPIASEWDRLAARSGMPSPFLTWGFNRAWWRAFGEDKLLRTIVVTDAEGRVRLIAPFYAPADAPQRWRFIADFSGDYNDVVAAADDHEGVGFLFRWLAANRDWSTLSLGRVAGDALPAYFAYASDPGATFAAKLRCWLNPRVLLAYRIASREHPYADCGALMQMQRLVKTKNYVRHVNWFGRNGSFGYEVVTSPTEIRALLPRFMDMHTREWQQKSGRPQFSWAAARRFFEYMIDDMGGSGSLRLDLLRFNGEMVAAHFGFHDEQRFYFYKPCFDLDYAEHCPGKVLMAYMIQWAAEHGLVEFDLLRGLDPYKDRYASAVRTTWHFAVSRSRLQWLADRFRAGRRS